jgi:monoamine oxidase
MNSLATRAGAKVTDTTGHRYQRVADHWEKLDDLQSRNDGLLKRVKLGAGEDMSLWDALAKHATDPASFEARKTLVEHVEGFHAADPQLVSTRWLQHPDVKQFAGESERRTPDGLSRIIRMLESSVRGRCDLRLNTAVHTIRWNPGSVEVHGESDRSESFAARSVIVTVPVCMMQPSNTSDAALRFEPELTTANEALSRIHMGQAAKVTIEFTIPFWRKIRKLDGMLYLHAFDQPFPTWWATGTDETPMLTAWAGGQQATWLDTADRSTLVDMAVRSLTHALAVPDGVVQMEMVADYFHDWRTDPYAQGAYSYVGVGGMDAYATLQAPIEGTVFLAGEATAPPGLSATMDGAAQSGVRAAEAVLAQLGARGGAEMEKV